MSVHPGLCSELEPAEGSSSSKQAGGETGKEGASFLAAKLIPSHYILWSHNLPIIQLNGSTRKDVGERQKNNTGSQSKIR